jgi:hypothetical protein
MDFSRNLNLTGEAKMDESEYCLAFQCNFGWTIMIDLTSIAENGC